MNVVATFMASNVLAVPCSSNDDNKSSLNVLNGATKLRPAAYRLRSTDPRVIWIRNTKKSDMLSRTINDHRLGQRSANSTINSTRSCISGETFTLSFISADQSNLSKFWRFGF